MNNMTFSIKASLALSLILEKNIKIIIVNIIYLDCLFLFIIINGL